MKIFSFIASILLFVSSLAHADAWQEFAAYQGGPEKTPLDQVFTNMHKASTAERAGMEAGLIGVLNNPESTLMAKTFACRFLREIGSVKAVDTLSSLLNDQDLSMHARYALEGMAFPEVDVALRQALDGVADDFKPGVLASIANRRDAAALKQVIRFAQSQNSDIAREAIRALGRMGTKEALDQLMTLAPAEAIESARLEALLDGADLLAAAGDSRNALRALDMVWKSNVPRMREAALRGWLTAEPDQASKMVIQQLQGDDEAMHEVALALLAHSGGDVLTKAASEVLPALPVDMQMAVIDVLGHRGDVSALPALLPLFDSADVALRDKAILAAGRLGNLETVTTLLKFADEGSTVAIEAIGMIQDPRANDVLIDAIAKRLHTRSAIAAVCRRGVLAASGELIRLTSDPDPALRRDAWDGITTLAQAGDLDDLMEILIPMEDKREKAMAAKAIQTAFVRMPPGAEKMRVVKSYYEKGDESTKMLILELVSAAGDDEGLNMVRQARQTGSPAFQEFAGQRLYNWPQTNAMPDLMQIATTSTSTTHRIQALRAYIRLVGVAKDWGVKAALYQEASELAQRPEEKNLIISGLREVQHPGAFKLLEEYMADEEMRASAEAAAFDLLTRMRANELKRSLSLMDALLKTSTDPKVIDRVNKLRESVQP